MQRYWDNNGKYQELAKQLEKLVPAEGACENARSKNKALDKFRRACNCYYDYYNNGLCNRKAEFTRVFPTVKVVKEARRNSPYYEFCWRDGEERLQQAMDEIILAAAREQELAA